MASQPGDSLPVPAPRSSRIGAVVRYVAQLPGGLAVGLTIALLAVVTIILIFKAPNAGGVAAGALISAVGGIIVSRTNQVDQSRRDREAYEKAKEVTDVQNAHARLMAADAADHARAAATADDARHRRDKKVERLQSVYRNTLRGLERLSRLSLNVSNDHQIDLKRNFEDIYNQRLVEINEAIHESNIGRSLEPGEPDYVGSAIANVELFCKQYIVDQALQAKEVRIEGTEDIILRARALIDEAADAITRYIDSVDRTI